MIYRRGLKTIVLLAAFLLSFSYSVFAVDSIHIVVKGDTIFALARMHQISQEELMRANGITNPAQLRVGMRLVIPNGGASRAGDAAPAQTSPADNAGGNNTPVNASAYTEYIVQKNDTLYSIARTGGVTLQELRDINGFPKNYVIKTGEKIKIPKSAAVASLSPPVPPPPPAPVPESSWQPPRANTKKGDLSIRWPVAATEVVYMSGNAVVLVSGKGSESIKSLSAGVVVHASPWRGYGNVAIVETKDGYRYIYGSCETLSVKKGDNIEPGTEVGKLGTYWASGKPDLVFMVSRDGLPVDPAKAPRF